MAERQEEESVRIVNCINSCWPECHFAYADIKKPTGEKFRDVLTRFVKGFLGFSYQFPAVGMHDFSRNPEMFGHLENTIALYRDINSILNEVGYQNLKYGDLIKPTTNTVREVLLCLVNFLAYFENEEASKEEIEAEIQALKHQTLQNERRLIDEERHLAKCRQSEEEKKLQVNELRRILVNRKEKYMKIEAAVTKLEGEVEDTNKRIQNVQARLEQAVAALKQVDSEKEKAAEAVVPDPEALEADLRRSQQDKENIEAEFTCLKSRLPVLEQQIQDRTLQLKEHKETHQRLAQVKARESKTKLEWQKADAEFRRVEEEKQLLDNQLKKDTSLIESKKRMLEEYNQKVEQLRGQLEKARSDVKQCMSEEDCRRAQMEARLLAVESEVSRLKQDLKLGQKALDEGAAVFEALHLKHQRDIEQLVEKHQERFEAVISICQSGKLIF